MNQVFDGHRCLSTLSSQAFPARGLQIRPLPSTLPFIYPITPPPLLPKLVILSLQDSSHGYLLAVASSFPSNLDLMT